MKKIIYFSLIFLHTILLTTAQIGVEKTKILILGTPHLTQVKDFKPSMLKQVIGKLDSMQFDAVCVERMPGQLLYDIKSRNDSAFSEITEGRWGGDRIELADTVRKALGISFLDAEQNIGRLLEQEYLGEDDRKELIYYYAAAADLVSASLQYRYLKDAEELFASGLDKYLVEAIEQRINSSNEIYSLALNLACNQQLNKIEDIDNFQDEAILLKYFPEFLQDYKEHAQELSSVSERPVYIEMKELIEQGVKSNDLSKVYEFVNGSDYMGEDFDAQWKVWLQTNFPSGSDRARYSLWEMRNLQISANILNVAAHYPGKKILVIIGSSHKVFLEKYLKQIIDIELLKYE